MDSGFGREIAKAEGRVILIGALSCIAVGVCFAFIALWLFHHIAIAFH
jgi:hypothetical protein